MSEGGRFALIVASDTHSDSKLSQLRAPAADADELSRVLRDPDIGGFDVAVSLNEPEHVVRRRLSTFFDARSADDLLVLHLSCHGVKDEDGRLYFATSDTEVSHLEATSIPADYVNRQMSRCRSRRIVLLLDCCYSGAFARGMIGRGGDRVDLRERFEGHGRIVLTASSAMEYSFEGDQTAGEGRPSVFTSAVVHGLATGEADRDRDGFVSVDELYDFAYERVRTATPSQTPGKWVFDVQGDFYLARNPVGVPEVVPGLPAELGAAIVSPFARVRRGAVEELAGLLGNPDGKLAAAARSALVELTSDDSQDVSRAARRYVEEPVKPTEGTQPALAVTAPTDAVAATDVVTAEGVEAADSAPGPRPAAGTRPEQTLTREPVATSSSGPAPHPSQPGASAARGSVPSGLAPATRAAAIALLAPIPLWLLIADPMERWNVFAVFSPLAAVVAAALLWLAAGMPRSGRWPIPFAAGVLLSVGCLAAAGALGLIKFAAERVGSGSVLLALITVAGAGVALGAGVACVRAAGDEPALPAEGSITGLAVLGTALTGAAIFIPYDTYSSLWTEVTEVESAEFALVPVAAVTLMVVAVFLLTSHRQLAAGILATTGLLTGVQFVGVLLAASFAVGEVGGVRPAWVVGVAGGLLAALAGWRAIMRIARSASQQLVGPAG